MLSFDNTEWAFAYKSNRELKRANFIFSIIARPWLVKIGLKIFPFALKWKLPLVKTIIRNTIFPQFVGGETLKKTAAVVNNLSRYDVQVILDYGVEGGKNGENGFDESTEEFIRVINYAATQSNIPFISIKMTGIASHELLEKMDKLMGDATGTLLSRYSTAITNLSNEEKKILNKIRDRVLKICEDAAAKNISVLIDAEETWIQNPVDALTILMMIQFNKSKAIVFNTMQLYRHDRLQFLKDIFEKAVKNDFIFGAKLVRGAYMEKERERAAAMNYPSPIHENKEACDKDFNEAIKFCIENLNRISLIVASHNEYSNLYTTELLQKHNIPMNHPHIHFSQLFGMSDQITFNLAKSEYSVSKYLPFGPIKDVIPYLMRRAEENTSVGGQTSRELALIKTELDRRHSSK